MKIRLWIIICSQLALLSFGCYQIEAGFIGFGLFNVVLNAICLPLNMRNLSNS